MIAALMEVESPLPNEVNDFCGRHWSRLTVADTPARDDGRHDIPMTRLTTAVADYAAARFGHLDRAGASNVARRVAKLQRDIEDADDTVVQTCYDRRRFGLLIRRTRAALSSSR